MEYKHLHILCPFKEINHTPLPRPPHHQFSNPVPSKSLSIQPHYWSQAMNLYNLIPLSISPFRQHEQSGVLIGVYTTLIYTRLIYITSI